MGFEIRTVNEDELAAWQSVMNVAFFQTRDAAAAAQWRRPYTDLARTWGAFDGDRVVATYRTFANELTLPGGRQLPVDAVTAVTVLPSHRRQGALTGMMTASLAQAAERGDAVSILIAARWPIYGRYGYGPAIESATYTIDNSLARFRPEVVDRGRLEYVDLATARAVFDEIFERTRRTQVGAIQRQPEMMDVRYNLATAPGMDPWKGYCVLHRDVDGRPDGLLSYSVDDKWDVMAPDTTLTVEDLVAATPEAYGALWRLCCEMDNIARVKAGDRSVDEPLHWLMTDGRAATQSHRTDFVWVRILDVPIALGARTYRTSGRVVIEVDDPLGYAAGRFVLEGDPTGATCTRTDSSPDLTMSAVTLGSASVGGVRLTELAAAGLIGESTPGALATADAMFPAEVTPWCNTWF